jgi:formylglycine-generating enzyme required for sulfatase activity/energy-coupling factor transporter ATP-binding protein EcfA2
MKREALVIGINSYQYLDSLEAPAVDAESIAQILEGPGEFTVQRLPEFFDRRNNNTRRIAQTKEVSQIDLKRAIATLFKPASDRQIPDTALLYYSGHGVVTTIGVEEGYLAASNTDPNDGSNGLSLTWLRELLAASPIRQQIVWIDACHSGMLLNVAEADPRYAGQVRDRCFIASSRDYQDSYTTIDSSLSVVTKALIEGLKPERLSQQWPNHWSNNYDLISFLNQALQGEGQSPTFTNFGEVIHLTRISHGTDVASDQPPKTIEVSPYQGLEKFTEETAEYYCGRDRLVSELLKELSESAFVPVIGASGSGKSSLVRAGLLPIARPRWEILGPITPSDHNNKPTTALAELLLAPYKRPGDKQKVRSLLESDSFYEAVAGLPGEKSFLLVVDQFEELFTLVAEEERRRFIRWLAGPDNDDEYRDFHNKRQESDRLRIVMTMRSDFMDQFQSYRQLNVLASQEKVCWVGPMTQQELQVAIAEPAQKNGYTLDPGLVDLIVGDVDAEPNSLPLLEYALKLLWDERDTAQQRLTLDAYKTLGGDGTAGRLKGALNVKAEEIYDGLTEAERTWAQRIFRRLVRTLPGTKDTRQRQRRLDLENLARTDIDRAAIANVLFDFEAARLLVPDGDYVDLAHEALIQGWQRFATWRKEGRDVLRLVDRIGDAYGEWFAKSYVSKGFKLRDVGSVQSLESELEREDKIKDLYLLREVDVAQIEAVTGIEDYLSAEQLEFVQQSRYKYKPWLDPTWLELVEIPGGTFMMGCPYVILDAFDDDNKNERPYHEVSVSAFRMGKYPVTQAQWQDIAVTPKVHHFLRPNPSSFYGDRRPVEKVSWLEAQEFCARLSRETKQTYRLPSEAEWEYACRAGAQEHTRYYFGDDILALKDYAWGGESESHPVGEKKPNAWGLYDMHGNVEEWCEDKWHDNYEGAPDDGRAWTSGSDSDSRLLRGGSWKSPWQDKYFECRSAYRSNADADDRDDNIGFRVVRVSS